MSAERAALARRIHDTVIQRLFGVSLLLGSLADLSRTEKRRCALEVERALAELRAVLEAPTCAHEAEDEVSVRLDDLVAAIRTRTDRSDLVVITGGDELVPALARPTIAHFLEEALRNARKHAQPTQIAISAGRCEGNLWLQVENDGVTRAAQRPGLGLRLLDNEARRLGGAVSSGRLADGRWIVRLSISMLPEPEVEQPLAAAG